MAFANTYDSTNPGSAVSNFEDVQSWVSRVVPEQTPVYSMAPKGPRASATFHEWTVDKLKTPSDLSGGISEGVDVADYSNQYEDRAKIGNYIQGFRDTWMVSKVQQRAASAGPADVANAKAKALINTKLGIEDALCSSNDRQAENGAGNPYKLRGLQDWIDSAGPSDVPADYRTPSGSILDQSANMTEAQFQLVVENLFSASGDVSDVTCVTDHTVRSQISDMTRSSTDRYNVNQDATSKEIVYAVSFFDTDYGRVSIVNGNPDVMVTDLAFLLKQDYYYVSDYIPMEMVDLEDQGGGQRGYCECWLTLCVRNPRAHGKIH